MKPYKVTIEVTTTYTVEVYAEDKGEAYVKSWELGFEQWSEGELIGEEITAVSPVSNIEEIQRESEDEY